MRKGTVDQSADQSATGQTDEPAASTPPGPSSVPVLDQARHSRQRLFRESLIVSGVLLLALLLRLWHLTTLTDNYDEGVYWASLRALHAGSGLFTPVFSSQPPLFLLSLTPLASLLGPTLIAGRLGVVGFSLLGILAMYLHARRLGGQWAGLVAAALLACDHLFLLQSQAIQAEVPAIALMLAAVAAASYADRSPWQASLLSGLLTACAILSKLFTVITLVPIWLIFLSQIIRLAGAGQAPSHQETAQSKQPLTRLTARMRISRRQLFSRALLLGGGFCLGLVLAGSLILLPYFSRFSTLYQQVITFHLDAGRAFASTTSQNPHLLLTTFDVYPLAVLALLGGLIGLWRRRWAVLIAAIWLITIVVILLLQAPLFSHHLVLLTPALALTAALGLAPSLRAISQARASPKPLAALPARLIQRVLPRPNARSQSVRLLQIGLPTLLVLGVILFDLQADARFPPGLSADQAVRLEAVANDLAALTNPAQQVITDEPYIAMLANRDVPPALVDTSTVRITTGYLTTDQMIAIAGQPQVGAILFYSGRFDQLPGWRAWVEGHYHLAREYGAGRALYLPGA